MAFLQKVTSNNVAALTPGKIQYTCFPNEDGGIVDDLLVYHYEPEKYLLVVNAANMDKDWDWCVSHNTEGAELENSSDNIGQLAVQGPKAILALQKLTDVDLSSIPYYAFKVGKFAGEDNVIISNTGYTGAGGFELYFYPSAADTIWTAIFEAGEEFGIKPVGLGARDTLRLEMGFCLYGNDLDDTTSPIEAGLGWITKFVEGKNFINRPMLEKQKAEGTTRKLVGFEMIDRGIPRHGYELVNQEGEKIGVVTSGINFSKLSTLLTTKTTGFPERRSISATLESESCSPCLTSVRKIITPAVAMAISACSLICERMTSLLSGSIPPVSIIVK